MRSFIYLLMLCQLLHLQAQVPRQTDFLTAKAQLEIFPGQYRIKGVVSYTYIPAEQSDSIYLNARKMMVHEVRLDGRKIPFSYRNDSIRVPQPQPLQPHHQLDVSYEVKPEQAVYFIGSPPEQVWTQGQGKYNSHWIPSFDTMSEKVEFDLTITAPSQYRVVANGQLQSVREQERTRQWEFNMDHPMSSYLVAFVLGDFLVDERQSSRGIPLHLYYPPEDSLLVEPTYRHSVQIFDFLEDEIGIPYPWKIYKQVPVKDFMYAGMENTTLTLFSDRYLVDSIGFHDQNYVNVNAHELAHQWFGNLVTEEGPEHHWLHEGFATYYALLAEKEIFGEAYFYWKLFHTARTLRELSEHEGGESLLDPGAGSTTFYEKGAWALFELQQLLGKNTFKEGIREYLETYQYGTVTVDRFLHIMEERSGQSLAVFKESWLEEETFPYREALLRLEESSPEIACYLELERELITDPGPSLPVLKKYWQRCPSPFFRAQVLRSYFKSMDETLLLEAIKSGDPEVQKALAEVVIRPEPQLFDAYVELLEAQSYLAREAILLKLWLHHPEQRTAVLDKAKGDYGLPNRHLRLLWLSLALITPGYEQEEKAGYLDELAAYTRSNYSQETRMAAFQYLYEIGQLEERNLMDLIDATTHHAWQFRKFSRDFLETLLKNQRYRSKIERMLPQLDESTKDVLLEKLRKT